MSPSLSGKRREEEEMKRRERAEKEKICTKPSSKTIIPNL
jgi:hypothetical protein